MFPFVPLFSMAFTVLAVLGVGIYLPRGVRTADAYAVGNCGAGCFLAAGSTVIALLAGVRSSVELLFIGLGTSLILFLPNVLLKRFSVTLFQGI